MMGKHHTDQRDRTLALARILYHETDETRPLPLSALAARLEKQGIVAERKSLYRDLAAFKRHGLAVDYKPGRGGGWYLTGRTFERGELRQLIDAVSVYPWLTDAARAALLEGLVTMAPAHLRAGLRRPVGRSRRSPGETDALRAVLDKIHAALQTGKALSFYPVELTPEKQLRAAGGRMVVSPKGLVWDNERYALVAWDHRAQTTGVFYPDRMAQVQVTGLPAQGREINLRHWTDAPFGPDPDLRRRVRLRCRRELAGEILDRFGRDTALIPEEDGETFTFAAEAVVGPAFWGWLTALEGRAEVVAPPWAAKVWTERYRPAAQGGEGRPTKAG